MLGCSQTLWKITVVIKSLSLKQSNVLHKRKTLPRYINTTEMKNLQKDIKHKYGIESQWLLQLWEKHALKECEYKNHSIFTLRCIDKGIVPVSVRHKSEGSKLSNRAREIIYKAEKQLLQDRVRCINTMLEDNR